MFQLMDNDESTQGEIRALRLNESAIDNLVSQIASFLTSPSDEFIRSPVEMSVIVALFCIYNASPKKYQDFLMTESTEVKRKAPWVFRFLSEIGHAEQGPEYHSLDFGTSMNRITISPDIQMDSNEDPVSRREGTFVFDAKGKPLSPPGAEDAEITSVFSSERRRKGCGR
jgi:hypothetical protein